MDTANAIRIRDYLQSMIKALSSVLDHGSIQAVNHYINHDEYEMAFEGLFIEVMKLKEIPVFDVNESVEIAYLLSLDKESVFLSNFWEPFRDFIAKCSAAE